MIADLKFAARSRSGEVRRTGRRKARRPHRLKVCVPGALAFLGFAFAAVPSTLGGDEETSGKILQETWEKTYPVGESLTLSVQNNDGRICIYGSDETELNVSAVKRAFTKERLDAISVRVALEGDTATIETNIPQVPSGGIGRDRSGTVDYTIIVPQDCSIAKAELAKGEVIVEGLRGSFINARVGDGRLLARNCFSQTQVSLDRGGMDVFFSWWEEEPLSVWAEIEDGDLRASFPEDVSLHLEAVASAGHVTNRFAEDSEQNGEGHNLSTTLGSGGPAEVKLRAGKGNIKIEKSY